MDMITISEISQKYGVSTRMLRHYEKIGLLASARRKDYAYRVYDEEAVLRLQQILLLRRLRIPLKEIRGLLEYPETAAMIAVFSKNLRELDAELTALSTIRDILRTFIQRLQSATPIKLHHLLSGADALASLSLISFNFKEDKRMNRLKDVRIIYLPPATVAAAHHVGDDPEQHANALIDAFVREKDLCRIKPDLRHYGFNHPNPVDESGYHGYEAWVTIPEDMELSPPLRKKRFPGGLYAAHTIQFGNFHEWEWLMAWIGESEQYEFAGDMRDQEHMCGLLDEHLNYIHHALLENSEPEGTQMDLLAPVREKITSPALEEAPAQR